MHTKYPSAVGSPLLPHQRDVAQQGVWSFDTTPKCIIFQLTDIVYSLTKSYDLNLQTVSQPNSLGWKGIR